MSITNSNNNQEWKTVTRDDKKRVMRRRGRSSKANAQEHQSVHQTSHEMQDTDVLLSCIHSCQEALGALLENALFNTNIQQIVCYGVGHFSRTSAHFFSASLWQLAMALHLRAVLDVPLLYYDPCTTKFETEFLESMGVQVLLNNEHGERACAHTLFFMPHCPSGLYENVLWSNWRHLQTILIFGNSLKSYSEALQFDGPCIQLVQPWLQEDMFRWTDVNAPGDLEGAFNDTYISAITPTQDFPKRPYDTLREVLATDDHS